MTIDQDQTYGEAAESIRGGLRFAFQTDDLAMVLKGTLEVRHQPFELPRFIFLEGPSSLRTQGGNNTEYQPLPSR